MIAVLAPHKNSMDNNETQPASQSQEAGNAAEKIGILDEYSLSELVKGTFLSDQEQTTAQKRINKLVAAKKQALAEVEAYKEKLAELESKLNEAPAQTAQQQDVSEAVAKLKTVEQVDAEWKRATEVLMWCEENPDGGTLIGPDGNEIDVDDRQVRSMKKLAIRRREIELPTRRHYLQVEREAETQTVKEFPWWKDPSTKEYQTAQQVLRDFPEIKSKRADSRCCATSQKSSPRGLTTSTSLALLSLVCRHTKICSRTKQQRRRSSRKLHPRQQSRQLRLSKIRAGKRLRLLHGTTGIAEYSPTCSNPKVSQTSNHTQNYATIN